MVSAPNSDLIRSNFRTPSWRQGIHFLTRIVTSCKRHGTVMPSGFLKLRIFWFKSLPGVLPTCDKRLSSKRDLIVACLIFLIFFWTRLKIVVPISSLWWFASGLSSCFGTRPSLIFCGASFFQPNLWVARN